MKRSVYQIIKRAFDLTASAVGLIVLSPLLLILALLVRVNLGSPVLFSQERPGLHGKIFRLYKFRSMKNAADSKGNLLPDEERLSRFGRILRASSLDELPETEGISTNYRNGVQVIRESWGLMIISK